MKVDLNQEEEKLKNEVQTCLNRLYEHFHKDELGGEVQTLIEEMGKAAHKLHISLKKRGMEPKQHAYMIKNRGMPTDDPQFYMHIHPAEDLLDFINDDHANDDPEDKTIGAEFHFRFYCNRWHREDEYKMIRTKDGWTVQHISIGGACDKGGRPFLFENLDHDSVSYPHGLDGWVEWLWGQAESEGLTIEQVQTHLDELANWVSQTEQNTPSGGIWEGY